jgi:DUF971 family protein
VTEADSGKPVVLERPDSAVAKAFEHAVEAMASELAAVLSGARKDKPVVLEMEPNQEAKIFKLKWSDGKTSLTSFKDLRFHCPCANCVDEGTGQRKIAREAVREDVHPKKVQTVGNYAVTIHWSDGHSTGIYGYDYLRALLVKS